MTVKFIGVSGLPGSGVDRVLDNVTRSVIQTMDDYLTLRCRYDLHAFTYRRLIDSTKGKDAESRLQHSIHTLLSEYIPHYEHTYDEKVELVRELAAIKQSSVKAYNEALSRWLGEEAYKELYLHDFMDRIRRDVKRLDEINTSTPDDENYKPKYIVVPDVDSHDKFDHLTSKLGGLTVLVKSDSFERQRRLLEEYDHYDDHVEDDEAAWMNDVNWNLILDVDRLDDPAGKSGIEKSVELLEHAMLDKWA